MSIIPLLEDKNLACPIERMTIFPFPSGLFYLIMPRIFTAKRSITPTRPMPAMCARKRPRVALRGPR